MNDNSTSHIQARVAKTVLGQGNTIRLGGRVYHVEPPTIGTLIYVSGLIAQMPQDVNLQEGKEKQELLGLAREFSVLPQIIGALIVGAKGLMDEDEPNILRRIARRQKQRAYSRVVNEIRNNASPAEIKSALVPLLENLQLTDFFVITTFLNGINLTKPTKVGTETEATASGR